MFRALFRPDVLQDGHIYGGLTIAAAGGWQLSPAITAIVFGLTLFALGLFAGSGRPHSGDPAERN